MSGFSRVGRLTQIRNIASSHGGKEERNGRMALANASRMSYGLASFRG